MKLAMLSNANLNTQEQYARRFFGNIPNRPTKLPFIDPIYRKPLKNNYRLMKVKTIRDIHQLTLEFPTILLTEYLEAKPADIVGSANLSADFVDFACLSADWLRGKGVASLKVKRRKIGSWVVQRWWV